MPWISWDPTNKTAPHKNRPKWTGIYAKIPLFNQQGLKISRRWGTKLIINRQIWALSEATNSTLRTASLQFWARKIIKCSVNKASYRVWTAKKPIICFRVSNHSLTRWHRLFRTRQKIFTATAFTVVLWIICCVKLSLRPSSSTLSQLKTWKRWRIISAGRSLRWMSSSPLMFLRLSWRKKRPKRNTND